MRGANEQVAFIQIDMRFKDKQHRLFTFARDLSEYELNAILDDLIDEMAGLEYTAPIRVIHQYRSGAKIVTPLAFYAVED